MAKLICKGDFKAYIVALSADYYDSEVSFLPILDLGSNKGFQNPKLH